MVFICIEIIVTSEELSVAITAVGQHLAILHQRTQVEPCPKRNKKSRGARQPAVCGDTKTLETFVAKGTSDRFYCKIRL